MSSSSGKLWVVATPLGNHGDLSPRAGEILGAVQCVLAEDSRRTGLLLSKCGISAQKLISFHDHNEEARLEGVLSELQAGRSFALVSDAGTPLLSDPGFRLVRACREAGIEVSPVPGPSAPVAALSAAGIAPVPYCFLGFAPRKKSEQEAFFRPYAELEVTLVFFDRKDRLAKTLEAAHAILGHREVCIARELTKTYEEFIFFRLEDHADQQLELLGEVTVILGPPDGKMKTPEDKVAETARKLLPMGLKTKELAKEVQARVRGWSAKEIYRLLQQLGEDR